MPNEYILSCGCVLPVPEAGTFAAAIEEALDDQVEQAELIYCTAHRRVVDVVVSREDS